MNKNRFYKLSLFVLFFLVIFHGINNYIWLQLNQHPPVDDEAFHLLSSLQYLDIVSNLTSPKIFLKLVNVYKPYPPFFSFSAALVALFFGKSAIVMTMTNILFLLGIFICLYFIGIKMEDRRIGILASCVLSFYPMFFHLSRMFMLEIALCFMVVASIAALIYSEGFKNRAMSILFGVLLGLGVLTKQFYVIFITGPMIFLLWLSLSSSDFAIRKKVIQNLLLSFLIGICIGSLWYLKNFRLMSFFAIKSLFDPKEVPHYIPLFSLRSFLFYLDVLINDQILLFFFVVFISALIFITFKIKKDKFFFLFLIWIIYSYFILTLISNKFWYYTMPYLPAVAFISAYGIINIKNNFLRKTAILLIFVIGLFQFFFISYVKYGHTSLHFAIHTGTKKDEDRMMDITLLPMKEILGGVTYYPHKGDWKIDAIVTEILKESKVTKSMIGVHWVSPNMEAKTKSPKDQPFISYLDSYTATNYEGLKYYVALNNIPLRITTVRDYFNAKMKDKLTFIVSPVALMNADIHDLKIEDYVIIKEFIMPDSSKVYLYKSDADCK